MNERSVEVRERIFDAAVRTFSAHGFGGSGMRLIASEAGVSVGTLYLYFASKEELFLTLMDHFMGDLQDASQRILQEAGDPRQALAGLIRRTLASADEHREMILLQGRELGFSFGVERKRAFFRNRRKMFEDLIREGISQGIFRPCDPEEGARIVFCVLRGYVTSLVIDEEGLYGADACVDFVLSALSATPSHGVTR